MAEPDFDFAGARVLVTGGSNGIGYGIAAAFAAAGAAVTVTGRRPGAGDYDRDLGAFDYRPLEIEDGDAIDRLAASLDRLDVLVNNAGASLPGGRDEWDVDVFERAVRINLFGAFRLASACQPLLAASDAAGGAAIVNLASMSSYFGIEVVPGYGAAKAAIVQTTKTMAVRWARDGIRANAVAPGLIRSNMTAAMESVEDLWRPMIDRTPLGRWGNPEDVAPAVLFLASDAARYITGQTLAVDGGYSVA